MATLQKQLRLSAIGRSISSKYTHGTEHRNVLIHEVLF